MPPRRTGRQSSNFGDDPDTPSPFRVRRNGRVIGPAKYNTSYGSPATLPPMRRSVQPQARAENIADDVGSVLDNVVKANKDDAVERAQREVSATPRRARGRPRKDDAARVGSAEPEKPLEEEGGEDSSEDPLLRNMPAVPTKGPEAPAPEPEAPAKAIEAPAKGPRGKGKEVERRVLDKPFAILPPKPAVPATPAVPYRRASTPDGTSSKAPDAARGFRKAGSVPPETPGARSWVEESGLFGDATTVKKTNQPRKRIDLATIWDEAAEDDATTEDEVDEEDEAADIRGLVRGPTGPSPDIQLLGQRRNPNPEESRPRQPPVERERKAVPGVAPPLPKARGPPGPAAVNPRPGEPVPSTSLVTQLVAPLRRAVALPVSLIRSLVSVHEPPRPIAREPAPRRGHVSWFRKPLGHAIITAGGCITVILIAFRLIGPGSDHLTHSSGWGTAFQQWLPPYGLPRLGDISADDSSQFYAHLVNQAKDLARLHDSTNVNKAAIDRLQRVLPSVIHMDLDKSGKPVVSQDFWYALKDRMTKDRDVFTLSKASDGSDNISDLQWAVLKKQVEKSGLIPESGGTVTGSGLTKHDVEVIARDSVSKSWETWFKRNDKKVRDLLADVIPARGADERTITKVVAQKLKSKEFENLLVTKADFIKTLKADLQTQRLESRAELGQLEKKLVALMEKMALMPRDGGPTTQDVHAIAKRVATDIVANAQLNAAAGSYIGTHWISELSNQVNFFSPKTGAAIDDHYSSPSYQPAKPRIGTREWLGLKPLPGTASKMAALQQWEEHGDCWCAATRDTNATTPNPATIAVKMAHAVVPQHFVVEHIAATATLDPGAMPREMELWAQISEYGRRREVKEWSAAQFGDRDARRSAGASDAGRLTDDGLADHGFVKIAEFTYENQPLSARPGGTPHIERLSSDLTAFDAATDHIVVRALTNYGQADYTCFYRVRLYGKQLDEGAGFGYEAEL